MICFALFLSFFLVFLQASLLKQQTAHCIEEKLYYINWEFRTLEKTHSICREKKMFVEFFEFWSQAMKTSQLLFVVFYYFAVICVSILWQLHFYCGLIQLFRLFIRFNLTSTWRKKNQQQIICIYGKNNYKIITVIISMCLLFVFTFCLLYSTIIWESTNSIWSWYIFKLFSIIIIIFASIEIKWRK